MPDPWSAAAAAIRAQSPDIVTYTGGGLAEPTDIRVIWTDAPGVNFPGAGDTLRTVTMEVAFDALPSRPSKADRVTRFGDTWKPKQTEADHNVQAWSCVMERV